MFHPKHLVLASPQLGDGAPILVIIYSPEQAWEGATAADGGMFGGWVLIHALDADMEKAELVFAEQIVAIDSYVEEVVDRAIPGTYSRETAESPFEREWDDGDDAD